jgi:PAS domain S-box-containing protein
MATLNQTKNTNFNESILTKSTILYLEDDEIIRNETRSIFEKIFKNVLTGEDGQVGLDLYNANKDEIDIILTDINMPNMDGIVFMSEIRKQDFEIPVLVVTAFNDIQQLIKAIKLKVTDYIVKPMQLNTTLKILNKTLQDNYNNKLILKQQNELHTYKEILDLENLVSETDLNGDIIYANDIFCEISGYSKDELIGANHNIVRHPDNSPKIFEELWQTIQNKQTWRGKLKNRTKNGEDYYVRSTVFPILDGDGNIEKYVATRFLITEQEEEKHKLKKYIMHQKSNQVKHQKNLQEQYDDALHLAKMQKDEQVAKFIHELNEQIKLLRTKHGDDKGRILSLERELKEATSKVEEIQIGYQGRIRKLHDTAKIAVEQYQKFKKQNIMMSDKLEKSQEGIINLQVYIDEYRAKIKNLNDLIESYEKQYGKITVR